MKKNTTKRALISSVLSLSLCVVMLIGSTFAWFTDVDTTELGNIVSGSLDVEITDAQGNKKEDALQFLDAEGNADILWEPDATFRTEGFMLKNFGTLDLKLKLELNNPDAENILNDVITLSLVKGDGTKIDIATMKDLVLEAGASTEVMYIEGYMSQKAGNEYQGQTLSGIAITVYANQLNGKEPVFYENGIYVGNADELLAAFSSLSDGDIIVLTDDIDLTGKAWTPVSGVGFTLDGDDYTITGMSDSLVMETGAKAYTVKNVTFKNLTVDHTGDNSSQYAALFSYVDCETLLIENVTLDGANIKGDKYTAGFIGWSGPSHSNVSHSILSCTLKNSTIIGGGSTGGVAGQCGASQQTNTFIDSFKLEGVNTIQGEDNAHTGTVIGTANTGKIVITETPAAALEDGIGRLVPSGTGSVKIGDTLTTEAFSRVND